MQDSAGEDKGDPSLLGGLPTLIIPERRGGDSILHGPNPTIFLELLQKPRAHPAAPLKKLTQISEHPPPQPLRTQHVNLLVTRSALIRQKESVEVGQNRSRL